jgi:hypothetical protein
MNQLLEKAIEAAWWQRTMEEAVLPPAWSMLVAH